ncbi:hypothetical protein PILCRDRAFT_809934 [Piloderma croceum F 1598]|uniref:Uncharacterized protein n=1 Tax=Piloderma croceum (strain F 1598) TaxID=765440 RepID=A0A0C3G6Q5_PILCF|nr:hypothetical protein PILCRDRAFT_809934 [Piloderma croceum F 1598]
MDDEREVYSSESGETLQKNIHYLWLNILRDRMYRCSRPQFEEKRRLWHKLFKVMVGDHEYQIGFVRSQIAPSSSLLANNWG